MGAGSGGICAAKNLIAAGVDVTVFEIGSKIGGMWVYENDSGRSSAYSSLRINSEQRVTAYPDYPFPDGTPIYPGHELVAAYLKSYADHFGVTERVQFNSEVTRIEDAGDGKWRIRLANGDESVWDGVVVSPGHQAEPHHPDFHEDFAGEYLHVHHYRTPGSFAGKRVLVVGMGNSALDVGADLAKVAKSVELVARSPVLILPRDIFGRPLPRILRKVERPWMPWEMKRRIRVGLSAIAYGSMESYGLKTPKTRTHGTMQPAILDFVADGRVSFRPGIKSVDGQKVAFEDGGCGEYDVMIAATGYEVDLPFLPEDVVRVQNRKPDLYLRMFAPEHPGLYFVGYFNNAAGSNISLMDLQGRALAKLVAGEATLPSPSEMREAIEAEVEDQKRLFPDRSRYGLELDPVPYREAIEAFMTGTADDLSKRRIFR
ncbi:flavin-containing monooxygenase [Granulicoccus phenolivorans]|uniref:flavin-containing monooxygenase n=1 Tax=Granulicoccus phenolivorans TaxID=266854 RepID=UPI0004112D83|nr:NAD(P)-binding domain-containing protein [Granulicoccus phenolivorans]